MTKYQISVEDVECLELLFIQQEHIILEEDWWNRNSVRENKTSVFQGHRLSKSTNSNTISGSRSFKNINTTFFSQNLCYVIPILGKLSFESKYIISDFSIIL